MQVSIKKGKMYLVRVTLGLWSIDEQGHHMANLLHVRIFPWCEVLSGVFDGLFGPTYSRQLDKFLFPKTKLQGALQRKESVAVC